MSEEQERTLRAVRVKQLHEPALLAKANVLGVGVGVRQHSGKSSTDRRDPAVLRDGALRCLGPDALRFSR